MRACACAGVCAPGEAVEAAAPWLGAGRRRIARFSPAGAGDLQAIPLYFCPELTSPAPQPGATSLTVAPAPIFRRCPSSVVPPPPASSHKLAKKRERERGSPVVRERFGQPVAGSQGLRSRYCLLSSPSGPRSPCAGPSSETRDAPPSPILGEALALPITPWTSAPAHITQAGTPTLILPLLGWGVLLNLSCRNTRVA